MPNLLIRIILLFIVSYSSYGQVAVPVSFGFYFDGKPLQLGNSYSTSLNSEVTVATFRLYVSHFTFLYKGKEVYTDANSYYLLDALKPESLLRKINIPETLTFDAIRFNFGIDEATNTKGVGEGDLDPTNDMYWAWQSGYINLKLEGTYGTKHEPYQYHLGGFLKPNVSCRPVELPVANHENVVISIDVGAFFKETDISAKSKLMSPGALSVQLSALATKMFHIL